MRSQFVGQGDLFDAEKASRHVEIARLRQRNISKVLLCVDSECTDVEETKRLVAPIEAQLTKSFPRLTLRYVVVDHALEGWLLADPTALRQVLGPKARLPSLKNPEATCRPANLMRQLFRRNSLKYKKTLHATRLAEHTNPDRLSQLSDTFRFFQQALTGP